MNSPIKQKISIIIVNYYGGKYINLLLNSIKKVVLEYDNIDIIIVNNFRAGFSIRSIKSLPDVILKVIKHYINHLFPKLFDSRIKPNYIFKVPKDLRCMIYDTSIHPVFWTKWMNIKGKGVSMSHTAGQAYGYSKISSDTELVILMDQDIALLNDNWLKSLTNPLKNEKVVLVGAVEDKINDYYDRPFVHDALMIFKNDFYKNFNLDNLFMATKNGDQGSLFTYLCKDNGMDYFVFKNSRENPMLLKNKDIGEIAIDEDKKIFFAHHHHASNFSIWEEFVNNPQKHLEK